MLISLLGLGLLSFSTALVAAVAHYCPGLWLSPGLRAGGHRTAHRHRGGGGGPKGLPVPRRVTTILEGESMVDDAAGLIAYRYAVAAVATG